ncbi:MAG: thioredoxin [Gammaproteobacteria bacterium]|jgi:thioredoxin 1
MSHIQAVGDDDFQSMVLEADKPVLVDFWAPWCGPCKAIAPVLEAIAAQYSDKIQVVKINVDDHTDTPSQYGVRGIPTLMLFKGGEVLATQVGAVTQVQLASFIDAHIKD